MPNAPQAKSFNTVVDDDFEAPKFGEAKIIRGSNGYVHQYMELSKKNGNLDFKGNSITFEVEVSMDGGKPLKYFWESKSPPISRPHVTEMKDMVTGTRKNTLAKAILQRSYLMVMVQMNVAEVIYTCLMLRTL